MTSGNITRLPGPTTPVAPKNETEFLRYKAGVWIYDSADNSHFKTITEATLVNVTERISCMLWMSCTHYPETIQDVPFDTADPNHLLHLISLISNDWDIPKNPYEIKILRSDFQSLPRAMSDKVHSYYGLRIKSRPVRWSAEGEFKNRTDTRKCPRYEDNYICRMSNYLLTIRNAQPLDIPKTFIRLNYLTFGNVTFKNRIPYQFQDSTYSFIIDMSERTFSRPVANYEGKSVYLSDNNILFSWVQFLNGYGWENDIPEYGSHSLHQRV